MGALEQGMDASLRGSIQALSEANQANASRVKTLSTILASASAAVTGISTLEKAGLTVTNELAALALYLEEAVAP